MGLWPFLRRRFGKFLTSLSPWPVTRPKRGIDERKTLGPKRMSSRALAVVMQPTQIGRQ